MQRLVLVHLIACLGLAAAAQAQTPPVAPAPTTTQAPTPAAAPEPRTPGLDESRSLFEQTWHQLEFGGRFSSVSGDPARWQRYQDLRDGVIFTDARYVSEVPGEAWQVRATADNVGYRDQRYTGRYERTGRFVLSGMWDEIPQFYSVDTKTPYTNNGTALVLDDATQRAAQTGSVKLPLYVPLANQFDLRERRDIGTVRFLATPTTHLDVTAAFKTTRHRGELPWGASFGFGNDVEVALPYDSRTNDVTIGTEWKGDREMLRVAYDGSWFNNLDDTLVWDSPLRLDDSASSGPGRGRMSLWPTNSAQTVSVGGYATLARRTQVTGFLSFGSRSNDEPLQPFTINAVLPQMTLPRSSARAEADIFSTTLSLNSHPADEWRFSGRLRRYGYDNQMPATSIPQFINYDTSIKDSSTGGPELFAHSRTNFDADATWSGFKPAALTAGYGYNNTGNDFRIFESTGEHVFRLQADALSTQWTTFHAKYEFSDRTGSGLNEDLLVEIGEQPDMRHYDLANRTRHQFTGIVDIVPNDQWTFSASGGSGKDNYPDSYFGLQHTTFGTISFAADYQSTNGITAGGTYNYEHYAGLQRSRSASPGQEDDPLLDWTADTAEDVHYFSVYGSPPNIGKAEVRVTYDFSHAEGRYLYTVVPGGKLPPPSQLPNVFNKLQQLHLDVRYRLSTRLAVSFSYLYEPFRVYDFALDPSVVNDIVQPSSLVMGYVYRPYTANSGTIGLRYYW